MKLLVCIPVIYSAEVFRECLTQYINIPNVDVFIWQNGAEPDVKKVCDEFRRDHGFKVRYNKVNDYVNPTWNEFIRYFLDSDYDYLCIANSDLTLQNSWATTLKARWKKYPDDILIPKITDDKTLMYKPVMMCSQETLYPTEGTAGVFITLNKKQAAAVYPIEPPQMLVWFGDNFLYGILRSIGYRTVILDNFIAYHHTSTSVQRVEGISAIIENDKDIWNEVGQYAMQDRINKLKQK